MNGATPKRVTRVPLIEPTPAPTASTSSDDDPHGRVERQADEADRQAFEQHAGDNAREADDRADGKVDAAGEDHHQHPDGEDRVDRDVPRHRHEVVPRQVRVREQPENDDQDDQRDEGAQLEQHVDQLETAPFGGRGQVRRCRRRVEGGGGGRAHRRPPWTWVVSSDAAMISSLVAVPRLRSRTMRPFDMTRSRWGTWSASSSSDVANRTPRP